MRRSEISRLVGMATLSRRRRLTRIAAVLGLVLLVHALTRARLRWGGSRTTMPSRARLKIYVCALRPGLNELSQSDELPDELDADVRNVSPMPDSVAWLKCVAQCSTALIVQRLAGERCRPLGAPHHHPEPLSHLRS